jgi:ABC-type transport system involved in resistance to organic solvents, periplasmic component
MNSKESIKKISAGVFFIIGVILIFMIVFMIGMEKGSTQPKFQVSVVFKQVGGLSVGAAVRLSGVDVGNVSAVDFLDQKIQGRGVRVVLNIFKKYRKQIEYCSIYSIKAVNILGEKIVDIEPPGEAKICDLNSPIIGFDPLDVQDFAESFKNTAVSLTKMTDEINSLIGEFQYFSKTSKRVLDRIEDKLIEGNLIKVF